MNGAGSVRVEVGRKSGKAPPDGSGKGSTTLLRVVGFLLFLTAALLVWVGVGTVRASRDVSVRAGLDYETFLGAVDDLIVGAGDSALLRFDEVEERISRRRTVSFDTLTILADPSAFPSFISQT